MRSKMEAIRRFGSLVCPRAPGGTRLGLTTRRAVASALILAAMSAACTDMSDDASTGEGSSSGTDGDVTAPKPSPNRIADVHAALNESHPAVRDLRFAEVGREAGLNEPHAEIDLLGEDAMTSGAAVVDVDADGDLDVYLTRVGKANSLYFNDGHGKFSDVTNEAGLQGPDPRYGSSAAAFADIDGDGDLDVFVSGAGWGRNALYLNDGTNRFVEVTAERGLVWPPSARSNLGNQTHGATFADVDNDGDMDLLVLQWYAPVYGAEGASAIGREAGSGESRHVKNRQPCEAAAALRRAGYPVDPTVEDPLRSGFFLNDGNGNFEEASERWGLPLDQIMAFTGIFSDFDEDGWLDLAVTGDGCTSRLLRNVHGERFEDITLGSGVGTDENGMGAVVRDIDGDGHADWFITSISYPTEDGLSCPVSGVAVGCSGNRAYLGDGTGTFRDATDELGLRDGGWGWGAAIEDFDQNGSLEVVMTNGFEERSTRQPQTGSDPNETYFRAFVADADRFWVKHGDRYEEAAAAVGLTGTGLGHALVAFDMDDDGDLDLLVAETTDRPKLYRNDAPREASWLRVRLMDPDKPGNNAGEGARITVVPTEDSSPVVDWINSASSYEAQKPPEVHLGLGSHNGPVARVEVLWPGEARPQVLTSVDPNQLLTVERSQTPR